MKNRVQCILNELGDDQQGKKLVGAVLKATAEYVRAVTLMEAELMASTLDGAELRNLTEILDRSRTLAHNALIDALNICTRYLTNNYPDMNPANGIYPEPSHLIERNRRAIGDWAGRIVHELYTTRR